MCIRDSGHGLPSPKSVLRRFLAVRDSNLPLEKNKITGFIGPSGCGKSTVLRSLNRMNDLIPVFRFEGKVTYHGQDIYDGKVDPAVSYTHLDVYKRQRRR